MSTTSENPSNEGEEVSEQIVERTGEEVDFNAQVDARREQMQPTKMESFMAVLKSLLLRAMIIYFITTFFRQQPQPKPTEVVSSDGAKMNIAAATNIFQNGTLFDMYVYMNEDEYFKKFDDQSLIWKENGLVYGDWYSGENSDGTRKFTTKFKPSPKLQNNGSIYLHVFLIRSGHDLPTEYQEHFTDHISYGSKQINKYKKLRYQKTHNLLTGETEMSAADIQIAENTKEQIISHWHPNITINLVTDQTNWSFGSVPPPLDEYIKFTRDYKQYKPPVYLNDYWNMHRDYFPLNNTVEELELQITFQPLSLFKWQLYTAQAMKDKLNMFSALAAEEQDEDQDTIKELLLETSPILLALTVSVSLLHSVFELLAFKNDIQFWNNRQSLEGLSVRSVFFNVFQSLIVLLYVLDNETNVMVRISCGIGLLIEVWKIQKVMDVKIDRENKLFGIIPKLVFNDKGSYVESSTRQYDTLAFRYLSWACFPLLIGYGVYSLLYQEHKGWYSFILNMLYGYLLTFGFIMMTPQLFINYKLKSVAHLPWRMMTYKFLNTFIDDIFAFVIKMPTMYRIGCFRDDIVFFIFLYQRWIYKVDHSRLNEFGFSGDMETKDDSNKNTTPAIENKTEEEKKNE